MIAVLKPNTSPEQREHLIKWLKTMVTDVHVSEGKAYTVLGLVGDTSRIDPELLESLDIVESVQRVSEPYKKCSRQFHPEDTVVEVGKARIGAEFCIIASHLPKERHDAVLQDVLRGVVALFGIVPKKPKPAFHQSAERQNFGYQT